MSQTDMLLTLRITGASSILSEHCHQISKGTIWFSPAHSEGISKLSYQFKL